MIIQPTLTFTRDRRTEIVMSHVKPAGQESCTLPLSLTWFAQARCYGTHGINRPWAQLQEQQGILSYPRGVGLLLRGPRTKSTRLSVRPEHSTTRPRPMKASLAGSNGISCLPRTKWP